MMQDVVHFEIVILSAVEIVTLLQGVVHFVIMTLLLGVVHFGMVTFLLVTLLQGVVHFEIMTLLLGVVHYGIVTLQVHGGPRSSWVSRYHGEWDGLEKRVHLLRNDTVGVPSAFGQHLGYVSATQRQTDHPIV